MGMLTGVKRPEQAFSLVERPEPVDISDPGGGFEARLDVRGEAGVDSTDPLPMRLPCFPLLDRAEGVTPGREPIVARAHVVRHREGPLNRLDRPSQRADEAIVDQIERVAENAKPLETARRTITTQQHAAAAREHARVAGEPAGGEARAT
jgi:hypothetical protein